MGKGSARRVAWMGLLCALCIALSFLESLIPLDGVLPPGIKLGLSNLVILYALYYLNPAYAYGLALLKGGFAFLTRGTMAGLLSTGGGLSAATVMLLLLLLPGRREKSPLLVSVAGGVVHNMAQLVLVRLLLRSAFALYYLPVLLFFGVVMGAVSALIFSRSAPYLERLDRSFR